MTVYILRLTFRGVSSLLPTVSEKHETLEEAFSALIRRKCPELDSWSITQETIIAQGCISDEVAQ